MLFYDTMENLFSEQTHLPKNGCIAIVSDAPQKTSRLVKGVNYSDTKSDGQEVCFTLESLTRAGVYLAWRGTTSSLSRRKIKNIDIPPQRKRNTGDKQKLHKV